MDATPKHRMIAYIKPLQELLGSLIEIASDPELDVTLAWNFTLHHLKTNTHLFSQNGLELTDVMPQIDSSYEDELHEMKYRMNEMRSKLDQLLITLQRD